MSHLKYIALGLFLWTSVAVANHPNIVYILADDQGYGEAAQLQSGPSHCHTWH